MKWHCCLSPSAFSFSVCFWFGVRSENGMKKRSGWEREKSWMFMNFAYDRITKSLSCVCSRRVFVCVCIYLYAKREMNGSFTSTHAHTFFRLFARCFFHIWFFFPVFFCMHLCLASDKNFPAASSQKRFSKRRRNKFTKQTWAQAQHTVKCICIYGKKMRANQFGAHIPCFVELLPSTVDIDAAAAAKHRSKIQVSPLCALSSCSIYLNLDLHILAVQRCEIFLLSHTQSQISQSKLVR